MKPTCFVNINTFKDIFFKHVRFAFGEPFGVHHTIKIKIIL
jgi:hypothetical protein